MLVYGLQGFQDETIHVLRSAHLRPNPRFLEERFDEFRRKAG